MADKIYRVNVEKIAGRGVSGFLGEKGDLVYDPDTGIMYVLDGETPGGEAVGGIGTSGTSGYSGVNGASGTSGYSGIDGASGYSGIAGASGYSGIDGASGYSGSFVTVGAVAPATAKGAEGDTLGSVISAGGFIYICTATWTDGVDDIWAKIGVETTPWA